MLLLLGLLACDNTLFFPPEGGGTNTGSGPFCAVEAIFDDKCTSCHSPAAGPLGQLDLQTDAWTAIVNVPSPEYAGETLVIPGDPDGSFLQKKLEGTHGDHGARMPLGAPLPADQIATVRDWIAAGAEAGCDSAGDTDTNADGRYHPDGWASPERHGTSAKMQEQECTACHGDDLTGGAVQVSCDACHPQDWRTTCTFCHGGQLDATGAPPLDIDGQDDPDKITFPPHHAHVTATDHHAAYDCTQCHVKPTNVLSPGHVFVGDDTPGEADVHFGVLSSGGRYDGSTCSNVYCHGNGRTSGDAGKTETFTCSGCHGHRTNPGRLSGEHEDHVEEGVKCGECHSETVSEWDVILDPAKHVNGSVNLKLPSTITRSGDTCNGSCHGVGHDDRDWD